MADPRAGAPAESAAELQERIAAERAGSPFVLLRPPGGGRRILGLDPERWRVTVGRHADADVSLAWDAEVSRAHALLEVVGGQWTLIDDGLSRNGSFVNGERLRGRRRLRDGDRMCFGETVVVFRDPREGQGDSTGRLPTDTSSIPLSPTQRRVLIALCRPLSDSAFSTPATNRDIAAEVFLSVDAVKAHLRALFDRFGLEHLPQNEKRARLAATALVTGLLTPRDF